MATNHKEILRRTVDALEKSLRRYPDNEKILHQLAVAYAQLGRFDSRSASVYQRASSLFPSDVKVQRAMSISYLVTHSADLARDLSSLKGMDQESLQRNIGRLYQLTREYPDSAHLHRALADLRLLAGEERDALQHYRCALALGITDLEAVCAHFENVRRLRDVSGMVSVFIADIYQRLGMIEEANKLFADLCAGPNPERSVLDKYAEYLQRRIEETEPRDEDQLARHLRQLTRVFLQRGNVSEALTWSRQLTPQQLSAEPGLAKDLARRLIIMEDFRQAFEYLSHIPLDQESKSILNEMAMHLERRGELDTAVYILQYINENDEYARESRQLMETDGSMPPTDNEISIEIETELQMAELHWKNRRWDNAFECYLRVLELGYEEYRGLLEPIDLLIERVSELRLDQLVFLSNFFAERRDWRRCMNFALRALQYDSALEDMSQRVLQSCDRILLENPEEHDVRLIHGDEHLRLGHIERAIQEFRRCVEVPEYNMKANRRLAQAYYRAGDLQSALTRYSNLPVLEIEDVERLYDLTIAFANSDQFKEAFETAKLIREYEPNFRDIEAKYVEYEEKMNQHNVGFVIDPKMRELIGDHSIGRYKYVSKIGSGGMGVVHKVIDLKTNNVVAMKILREGLSSSGKAIDRFFREARIAATLHHKNIVNILDYNISNNYGQSYIAMEYVDGPSLRDIIERKFSTTVDISAEDIVQSLHWVGQLCDALDATHKKGIIHRDIKPDNIMVRSDDLVKITDFGIVHIEEATFTPTGALIGTPRYMSPEQVHGGRIDARSDIYAVGIIIYELLIGSPPFISGDISYQQVNVLPTPPREICPAIPPQVDRIIMKCLEKAPADRYQTALELKHDLDETYIRLGGDPAKLRPATSASMSDASPIQPSGPQSPLTPPWLVPVRGTPAAEEEYSETVDSPAPKRDLGGVTKDLESDFDFESHHNIPDKLDTDFDL
jgi:serine/threonine protein kinase/tetratricopeptide (TPR) repeat protein